MQAARLWEATHALRESIGASLPLYERAKYDLQLTQVRAAMSEDAFAAAWKAGQAMEWEQAVDYALGKTTLPAGSDVAQ